MSDAELEILKSDEVQAFIAQHENEDVHRLLLKHKTLFGLPSGIIADQIIGRKKMRDKSPFLFNSKRIVYPPSLNLEQSSSEATAVFKTKIFSDELNKKCIADLTGGFGIDSLFFSRAASQIEFVEPYKDLLEIAKCNFNFLGIGNIYFHSSSAEEFLLKNEKRPDLIYIDPSRRDSSKKKVFRLQDCSPNISEIKDLIFESADLLLIKTSPLLDISQARKEIPFVKKIAIISVDNECKELLFFSEKNFNGTPRISTHNLITDKFQEFEFSSGEELNAVCEFSEPLDFLYEPNSSILKSGAFKLIGQKFGLKKIHPNTHLYTSTALVKSFPGRIFKIEKQEPDFKKDLPENKANVITRNFPLQPEELSKKLKFQDGGEKYVIAFNGAKQKYIVLASKVAYS